jgi:hypothetical protein
MGSAQSDHGDHHRRPRASAHISGIQRIGLPFGVLTGRADASSRAAEPVDRGPPHSTRELRTGLGQPAATPRIGTNSRGTARCEGNRRERGRSEHPVDARPCGALLTSWYQRDRMPRTVHHAPFLHASARHRPAIRAVAAKGNSTMPVTIPSVHRPCSSVESELLCPTCGSTNVVEARYTAAEVIFRCLHCWKLFTRRL